jgi:hypothetical protein
MTDRQLAVLNSLVTYAAENIPGGLNDEEREVAKIVGMAAIKGRMAIRQEDFESWKRCLDVELTAGDLTQEQYDQDLTRYRRIYGT